jgi:hypothetical protein
MRKILSILIALTFLVGASAFAAVVYEGGSGLGELRTATNINNTGEDVKTVLSVAKLIPGKCKVLGVAVNDIRGAAATEVFVGLADAIATTGDADDYLYGENEAFANTYGVDKVYPASGLSITNGVQLRQGAYTCATVYYIQVLA